MSEVFTNAGARTAGISANQIRGTRYNRVVHGVYTTGDANDTVTLAQAALMVSPPGSVLGGFTVLRFLGVELPDDITDDQRIQVVVPPGVFGPQRPQIKVTRSPLVLPPIDLGDGLLGVHPAQAWLQVSCDMPADDVTALAQQLMSASPPLATRAQLLQVLDALPGRRCTKLARRALRQVGWDT